jgi:hypothetical protein
MKEFKSSTKLVIITSIANLVGNVGLWVGAVTYRFLHAAEAQVDDSRIALIMESCWYAGQFLIALSAFALLVAFFRAVRSRKWTWVIASLVLFAALAYETVLVRMFYAMASMTP